MRTRVKATVFLAILVIVAAAGWVWFAIDREPQPSFGGESLSVWVRRCADANTLAEEREAAAAIAAMGEPAQRLLASWLRNEYSPGRYQARKLLPLAENSLLQRIFPWASAAEARAELAMIAFAALGPSASNTAPRLVALLADPRAPLSARRAQYALSQIGEPALDPLLHLLTDSQATNRDLALATIAELKLNRSAIARAWPVLTNCASDPDLDVADAALYALGCVAADPDAAVPVLLARLDEPRPRLRARAITALEHYADTSHGNRIIQAVQPLLGDPSEDAREAATNLLQELRARRRRNRSSRTRLRASTTTKGGTGFPRSGRWQSAANSSYGPPRSAPQW